MARYAALQRIWPAAAGGRPLPEFRPPLDEAALNEVESTMVAYAARRGMSEREQVREGAAALQEDSERAHWLYGLALVCDDEPLVVLDPRSARGFRLTMSGVGDNFQLHTLLADRLMRPGRGGLLEGERPEPAWVQAAETGPTGPFTSPTAITRRLRLFDGHGAYVAPEGWPADIQRLDGTRVLVLHPPKGSYGWLHGRSYLHMVPSMTLDREIPRNEALHRLCRITPARENDIMGFNRR